MFIFIFQILRQRLSGIPSKSLTRIGPLFSFLKTLFSSYFIGVLQQKIHQVDMNRDIVSIISTFSSPTFNSSSSQRLLICEHISKG